MKILKHGDLQPRKFTCTRCGCEFVADMTEYYSKEYDYPLGDRGIHYHVTCPDCKREVIKDSKQAPLYKDETIDNVIDRMSDEEVRIYCKMIYKKLTELCNKRNIYV